MGSLNSYFAIAENDYLYAKNGLEFCKGQGNYNPVVAGCAQAGEKYLKAVLEHYFTEDEDAEKLMSSHNLRSILNKLKEVCEIAVESKDCKWLGDFYFDTRYPGDNFTITKEEDATEAIRILELIRAEATRLLMEVKEQKQTGAAVLQTLKCF